MIGLKRILAQFGLKKIRARQLRIWVESMAGVVFDAHGGNGSGILIELPDRSTALLTAKHVVIECLSSGELTMQLWSNMHQPSFAPAMIRVAADCDAALLYLPPTYAKAPRLAYTSWAYSRPQVRVGMPIQCTGAPGDLKEGLNVLERTIGLVRMIGYLTTVTGVSSDKISCDVDESQSLPKSFGGMSGGPAFSTSRELVGINVQEERRVSGDTGYIHVLPLERAFAFMNQSAIFPGASTNIPKNLQAALFVAECVAGRWRGRRLLIEVMYRIASSTESPEQDVSAQLGRAVFLFPGQAYSVYVTQVFATTADRDQQDRDAATAVLVALRLGNWHVGDIEGGIA